jgi:hypothetical protein
MIKLTKIQKKILKSASNRKDGVVTFPENIKEDAANKIKQVLEDFWLIETRGGKYCITTYGIKTIG